MLEKFILFILAILFILFVFIFSMIPFAIKGSSDCLELGYPRAEMNIPYEVYCVKRVSGTDVVEKLSSIKGKQ